MKRRKLPQRDAAEIGYGTSGLTGPNTKPSFAGTLQAPKLNVPDAELAELRRRINATRWPTIELAADDTQGVQLATMQALARYWAPITIGASARQS